MIIVRSLIIAALIALGGPAAPALAEFTVCNATPSRVGVAIGYHDGSQWVSEGWWHLDGPGCRALIEGRLIARYYYLFAVDYDADGRWEGAAGMCTDGDVFTIEGHDNCTERGYLETPFFEVDTGEEPDFTVRLTPETRTSPPPPPPRG